MIEPAFQAEEFITARALVDALRLTNERWYEDAGRWVFRGHADAEWKLVPSLWRATKHPYVDGCEKIIRIAADASRKWLDEPEAKRDRILRAGATLAAKQAAVTEFARLSDQLRFPLPIRPEEIDTQPEIGDLTEYANSVLGWDWTQSVGEPDEVDALAQHHGVPTRLLDWTGSPLVAAFFAARESYRMMNRDCQPKQLAVWAIHPISDLATESRIRFFRCSGQFNSFLIAQNGLFTWDTLGARDFIEGGSWPCQADVLSGSSGVKSLKGKALQKLVLPGTEAQELLRLLRVEGISLAHLRPTFDNVAIAVMEHAGWPFRRP